MSIFNPVYIKGTTLGDTWFQLLSALYENGRKYLITKGSYEGAYRLAFDDVSGFIEYPHERPLAPLMPEGSSLPPPTDENTINEYFANYLMDGNIKDNEDYKYATFITGGEYEIPQFEWNDPSVAYNSCLDKGSKVLVPNQVEWIINHFKKYGYGTEHCFMNIGYPESNFAYDIPYTNEQERKTSPCLRGLGFRIIEQEFYECKECNFRWKEDELFTTNGRNHLCPNDRNIHFNILKINYLLTKVIYRSWDLFGGWPTNMGGFTLLNEYMASELNIEPGPLTFSCPSLHCYDFQLDVVKMRLGKE